MTILLGIDLETTGLDADKDNIIEVGVVLWNQPLKMPTAIYQELVLGPGLIPSEIEGMTGINDVVRLNAGREFSDVMAFVCRLAQSADYLVAHNADFEKSFLTNKGFDFFVNQLPWIDTKTDLPYPPGKGGGSLSDIAMSHGLFNPLPHRAATDALAMMQLLAKYDFNEVERISKAETMKLIVTFPYDETGERQKNVKSLGYYWEPKWKHWHKPCKDFKVEQEKQKASEFGFNVRVAEKEALTV